MRGLIYRLLDWITDRLVDVMIRIDPQMKFARSSGVRADLVDVDITSVQRISADVVQVQQLTEGTVGRFEGWHIEEQRA